MTTESSFYDDHYYKTHYGKIFEPDYYERISIFWKYAIFDANKISIDIGTSVLDYGAGLGQISAALNADCFDPSPVALQFLKRKGRKVFDQTTEIPSRHYNYVLSSHALEHALNPTHELKEFRRVLSDKGVLIVILPAEKIPGLSC
ncbi:MAG: methyltransferase domain-containing protein [Agriterribacter sp.]